VARNFNDWFDEIHLKSDRFKVIADAYKHLVFEEPVSGIAFNKEQKVVRAVWFDG
jgi:hypothetical protein